MKSNIWTVPHLLIIFSFLTEVHSKVSVVIVSDVLGPLPASVAEGDVGGVESYLLDHEEHGDLGYCGWHQDNDEWEDVGQDLDQSLSSDPPLVLDCWSWASEMLQMHSLSRYSSYFLPVSTGGGTFLNWSHFFTSFSVKDEVSSSDSESSVKELISL